MLVVLLDNQVLSPHTVCQCCLMADQHGEPRWQQGQLRCGRPISKTIHSQPDQFECHMGFRIANID